MRGCIADEPLYSFREEFSYHALKPINDRLRTPVHAREAGSSYRPDRRAPCQGIAFYKPKWEEAVNFQYSGFSHYNNLLPDRLDRGEP